MRKINIDKNTILIAAFMGALLLGFVLIFLEISWLAGINKNISKTSRDLILIEKEWPTKENYLKQSALLKEEIAKMHEKYILSQDESKLFSFLSQASKDFNVQIKTLKPSALKDYTSIKGAKFKYLPINVSAKSSFHNLANFLDYVQTGKYFFDITEISIVSDSPYHSIEMILCGLVKEK